MKKHPMTLTQKILARGANKEYVTSGQLIEAELDLVLANDITGPLAIKEFEKYGFTQVFDKEKIALVMDHFAPNKDIKSAQQCKVCRDFANKYRLTHFYDVGNMGIEHALLPEKAIVGPGEIIIGADSHTCTYGALGAFSTGVGSTDLAAGMATGKCWFKVPDAIKINLRGKLKKGLCGKDLILYIIGQIGVDGALYQSMEFTGEGVKSLTMEDRLTISNMAIEAGGKNGIFPVDEQTVEYVLNNGYNKSKLPPEELWQGDEDATYIKTIDIDLNKIHQTVAKPHLPENTVFVKDIEKTYIDQVVIGSCTNGRISDMEAAAEVLKGKHLAKNVRGIVIPATQKVYKECIKRGYIDIFIDAGCVVSTSTCGPCLGGYMGILADGEVCVATTNRNFVGRMGHQSSKVYLASPRVAAISGVLGYIAGDEELENESKR